MRIKALLFDKSNGEDILGFQKSCLNLLHVAVLSQVDLCITVVTEVKDPESNPGYHKFVTCFDTMTKLCKSQINEAHIEVWLTVFDYHKSIFLNVKNTDYMILVDIGADIDSAELSRIIFAMASADTNDIKPISEGTGAAHDAALEAAEEALYSGTRIEIKDEFKVLVDKDTALSGSEYKSFTNMMPMEIIAAQNIRDGKEYLNNGYGE